MSSGARQRRSHACKPEDRINKEGKVMREFVRRTRRRVAVVAMVLGAGLAFGLGTAAATDSGHFHVVPLGSKVDRTGYAFWLKWAWQYSFSHAPPYQTCQTVTMNGHNVGYLGTKFASTQDSHVTCTEPAGRPLYVYQPSAECSTFKGDHLTFGTSDSQLVKCAKAKQKLVNPTVHTTVDGKSVNVTKLQTGTQAYPVLANFTKWRSAAYGPGLLLTGLSKGTHVVKTTAMSTQPVSAKWTFDWTIKVK
jgi:hypothetical protein